MTHVVVMVPISRDALELLVESADTYAGIHEALIKTGQSQEATVETLVGIRAAVELGRKAMEASD